MTVFKSHRMTALAVFICVMASYGLGLYQLHNYIVEKEKPNAIQIQKQSDTPFTVVVLADTVCDPSKAVTRTSCQMAAVAQAVQAVKPDAILMPGDLQYESGELVNFQNAFDKFWGTNAELVYPVPGNHEYATPGASGYLEYWHSKNRDVGNSGYYSARLGQWRLFALNSNCTDIGGCSVESPQGRWLADELVKSEQYCSIAMWHHPTYTTGRYANDVTKSRGLDFWKQLDAYRADIVVNGHDHLYERFAPRSASGQLDETRGIRQFTVGTGGKTLYNFTQTSPDREFGDDSHFGFLILKLKRTTYTWEFRDTTQTVLDSGRGKCHW